MGVLVGLAVTTTEVGARPPGEQRTYVMVSLNGEPRADVVVVLAEQDVWLPSDYLDTLELMIAPGRRRTIEGRPHVSLDSPQPTLTYVFDEATVSLALTVSAEAIAERGVYVLGRDRPAGLQRTHNSSFFLNYAATGRASGPAAYAGEMGLSLRGALLSGSVAADGERLVRGPVRGTFDSESRLVRVELGDTVATSGVLSDGMDIAGVSVARRFDIDPYYVSQVPLRLRGSASTPSTAEVYVNGQLVRRVPVAPGTFELTGVAAPIGAGQTQVIVRDAFGREQLFQSSFYQPISVLQPGLHQFRYAVGVPRLDSTRPWEYAREPVVTGEHRYGLASRATIGGRFEASRHFAAGGSGLALALPFGEIEVEAGASHRDGRTGVSGLLGYRYQARGFSTGFVAVGADPDYATLASSLFERRRNRLAAQAFAGTSLGRVSLTASQTINRDWDGKRLERVDVVSSVRLTGRATLTLTAARNRFGGPQYEGFGSLGIALGRNSVASITAAADSDRRVSPAVSLQRSMGRGPSYGYQVQWNRENRARFAVATAQHRYGRVELRQDGFAEVGGSATLSGAIVGIGRRVYATRPVTDAFALIRVPDAPGVRVYSSNQLIGRTNRRGDLVVPDVVSYYGNEVSIDPDDLPLTVNVPRDSALVAPSYRAGGLALFRVSAVSPVMGRLEIVTGGRTIVPAEADLFVAGQPDVQSPLGTDGAFFFDELMPGPAHLIGRYKGRSFTCTVQVPAPSESLVRDLGVVRCVYDEDDVSGNSGLW